MPRTEDVAMDLLDGSKTAPEAGRTLLFLAFWFKHGIFNKHFCSTTFVQPLLFNHFCSTTFVQPFLFVLKSCCLNDLCSHLPERTETGLVVEQSGFKRKPMEQTLETTGKQQRKPKRINSGSSKEKTIETQQQKYSMEI